MALQEPHVQLNFALQIIKPKTRSFALFCYLSSEETNMDGIGIVALFSSGTEVYRSQSRANKFLFVNSTENAELFAFLTDCGKKAAVWLKDVEKTGYVSMNCGPVPVRLTKMVGKRNQWQNQTGFWDLTVRVGLNAHHHLSLYATGAKFIVKHRHEKHYVQTLREQTDLIPDLCLIIYRYVMRPPSSIHHYTEQKLGGMLYVHVKDGTMSVNEPKTLLTRWYILMF